MTTPPWTSNPEGHPIMQYVYELEAKCRAYKAIIRKHRWLTLTQAIICIVTGAFWGFALKWWLSSLR